MTSRSDIPNVQFGIRSKKTPWTGVLLSDLQTPKNGYICLLDRWWIVSNGEALFYHNSPQCNTVKEIAERVSKNGLYDDMNVSIEFVPVAYVLPSRD